MASDTWFVSIEAKGNNPSIFIESEEHGTIAQLGGGTLEVRRANANKLAAAPALLDALEQLVSDWDSVSESVQVPDEINENAHWDAARAAIAQARGR